MISNPFFPRLTWATNQPLGPINENRDFDDMSKSILGFPMVRRGTRTPMGFPATPSKCRCLIATNFLTPFPSMPIAYCGPTTPTALLSASACTWA